MDTLFRAAVFSLFAGLVPLSAYAQVDPQVKTIGIILPLSGPLAEYGQAAKNGFEMARENAPDLFQDIAFAFEDSQYQAKDAISALQKLRRDSSLRAIYVWGNHPSEAVAPLAEQYKIPTLAAASNPVTSRDKDYVIRAINHSAMFSNRLAEHVQEAGYTRIAVALSENSYLNGIFFDLKQAILAQSTSRTELVLIDHFEPSDMDFRSAIAKIRHGNFDAVAVFLMSGQVSQFYRQYAQQKVALPTLGTDFFESSSEIEAAGDAIQGAVYAHIGTSARFRSEYLSRYGNDLQLAYAANGYDTAVILAEALDSLGTKAATPEELLSAVRAQKTHSGVSGSAIYRDTEEGGAYFEFPVLLKRVKGNSFIEISAE